MIDERQIPRCEQAGAALAAWDPQTDLDEPVAVHVGACAACRAAFDARFPPAVAGPVAVTAPRRRRSPARSAALAVAAAVALALGTMAELWGGGAAASDEAMPPECPVEPLVVVAPECPAL